MGEHLPCKQGVKGSNPFISIECVFSINEVTFKEETTFKRMRSILIMNISDVQLYLENRIMNQISNEKNKTSRTNQPTKLRHARRIEPVSKKLTGEWLSNKERRVDALALRAEERRDKLRKATGSCK